MSTPPPGPVPPEQPFQPPASSGERPVQSAFGTPPGPQPPPPPGPAAPPVQFNQPNPFVQHNPYAQQNAPAQQPYHPFPPAYQPVGYGAVASTTRTNGFAVTSMVLGIVGIVLFCLYAIPSILAVIFGAVALNQFKTQPGVYSGRGMAIAGLVLGLVGVGFLVLLLAIGSSAVTLG